MLSLRSTQRYLANKSLERTAYMRHVGCLRTRRATFQLSLSSGVSHSSEGEDGLSPEEQKRHWAQGPNLEKDRLRLQISRGFSVTA